MNKSVKCILNRMTCKQPTKQATSAEELDYRGAAAPKNAQIADRALTPGGG